MFYVLVLQISPTKLVKGGLAVRSLGVEDTSGTAKVVLFKDLAEQTYKEGDIIQCTNVYRKVYNNKPQLTTVAASTLEVSTFFFFTTFFIIFLFLKAPLEVETVLFAVARNRT